jgi:tetratricopeptide (TPR) repeat protein
MFDWDWTGAENGYRRAIELNPSYALAHQWYAGFLGAMGRHEESINENKRAQELDPLSPIIGVDMGTNYISARKYDQAVEEFQKVLEMDPDYVVARAFLGIAYAGLEMYDEAITEIKTAQTLSGGENTLMKVFLGMVYALSGKKGEAHTLLYEVIELSRETYVSAWGISLIYVGLDQKEQALEWLEKAHSERDHWMTSLKVLPIMDSLRSEPRFKELLKKMDLD